MKIAVKVKANSKVNKVERVGEGHFKVYVKAPAREGRANEAVIETLSEYLDTPKTGLRIVSGHKAKNKLIDIL